jgi:hypothetical protein
MAPIKKKNHKAKKKTVAKRSASRKQQTLQTYTPSMYNEEEMFQPDNNDDKEESRVPQILIVLGFLGMAIALGVLWKKTIDEAANQNFPIILTVIAALLVLFWFFFLR